MRSLLIVEDEKLIRAGIRTMAERSGVEIEEIFEANNGEVALEILKEKRIEVIFTDIRMPRMDGIELVHHLEELPYRPYVVAISGFDDFSYAVEMLRSGASEYLLKPIEREKVRQVLTDLDMKIKEKSSDTASGAYEKLLKEKEYIVAVFPESYDEVEGREMLKIPGMTGAVGVLIPSEGRDDFLDEYEQMAAGYSSSHRGEDELKAAISEAMEARKRAFCIEKTMGIHDEAAAIPEKLREYAEGLLSETKRSQRLQMLAKENKKEFFQVWGALFEETRRGHLMPELLFEEMRTSMHELRKVYKQMLTKEELTRSRELENPLLFGTVSDYEEALLEFLVELNKRMLKEEDEEPMKKKMGLALSYIREHFAEDMNMATVSNHISMNYTLFSYTFKQYTGQNFVTYLKEIRLKAARELLEKTDDKIIDIAHKVGYENEKHFLKTFKSELGVSPSEYRRNMQRDK